MWDENNAANFTPLGGGHNKMNNLKFPRERKYVRCIYPKRVVVKNPLM